MNKKKSNPPTKIISSVEILIGELAEELENQIDYSFFLSEQQEEIKEKRKQRNEALENWELGIVSQKSDEFFETVKRFSLQQEYARTRISKENKNFNEKIENVKRLMQDFKAEKGKFFDKYEQFSYSEIWLNLYLYSTPGKDPMTKETLNLLMQENPEYDFKEETRELFYEKSPLTKIKNKIVKLNQEINEFIKNNEKVNLYQSRASYQCLKASKKAKYKRNNDKCLIENEFKNGDTFTLVFKSTGEISKLKNFSKKTLMYINEMIYSQGNQTIIIDIDQASKDFDIDPKYIRHFKSKMLKALTQISDIRLTYEFKDKKTLKKLPGIIFDRFVYNAKSLPDSNKIKVKTGDSYFEYLKNNGKKLTMARDILKIDDRLYKHYLDFFNIISESRMMNKGKLNENIISLKRLIDECSELSGHEYVKRSVKENILKPTFNNLDILQEIDNSFFYKLYLKDKNKKKYIQKDDVNNENLEQVFIEFGAKNEA